MPQFALVVQNAFSLVCRAMDVETRAALPTRILQEPSLSDRSACLVTWTYFEMLMGDHQVRI